MVVVGCAIMPHGALILEPDKIAADAGSEATKLHEAATQIANDIRQRRPHLIVLCTPHGVTLDNGVHAVYLNKWARGNAEFNGAGKRFAVECEIDVAAARDILRAMKHEGVHHIAGVEMFGGGDNPAHLGWAEAVPLWFLDEVLASCKVVILSMANPPIVEDGAFRTPGQGQSELANVSEYIKMGQVLSAWMDSDQNTNRRIYMIASAGLSHAHGSHSSCALLEQVPGSSLPSDFFQAEYDRDSHVQLTDENREAAELYDEAVDLWVKTGQAEVLLLTARKAVALAHPCGYSCCVLVHGLLDGQQLSTWSRRLLSRACPTSFGMLAADFLPRWDMLAESVSDINMGSLVIEGGHSSRISCWFLNQSAIGDIPWSEVVVVTKRIKSPPTDTQSPELVEDAEAEPPATAAATEFSKVEDEDSEASDDEGDEDDKFFEAAVEAHEAEIRRRRQTEEEKPEEPPPWTVEFGELAGRIKDSIVLVCMEAEDELEALAALATSHHAMALVVILEPSAQLPALPATTNRKKEHWEAGEVQDGARASIDWFSQESCRPGSRHKARSRHLGLAAIRREVDNAKTSATAALREEVRELQQALAAAEHARQLLAQQLRDLRAQDPPTAQGVAEALLTSCSYRTEGELQTEHARAELCVLAFVRAHAPSYQPASADLPQEARRLAAMVLQAYGRRKVLRVLFLAQASRARRFNGLLPDALTADRRLPAPRHQPSSLLSLAPSPASAPRLEFASGVAALLPTLRTRLPAPASTPMASPGRAGGFLAASTGPRGSPRNLLRTLPRGTELEGAVHRYDFVAAAASNAAGHILPFKAQRSAA